MKPQFLLAFLALPLVACAGSVETIGGGDGDGDAAGDGDGDGDWIGDGDGDSIGDGDGDVPGVGQPSPGGPPPVGVGGGEPGIVTPGGPPIAIGGGPGVIPGTTLPPVDPATCSTTYEWNDRNYCEREAQCGNAWAYASCDSWDGNSANCWCDRPGVGLNFTIDESLIQNGEGCERVLEACLGATTVEPIGETMCTTDYLEQDSNYCGTNLSCQTPVEFGGLDANVQTWSDAWCENYNGQWACECYSGNSWGQITFSDDQQSPGVCQSSILACQGGIIDPNLPAACAPRSQWAEEDYCNFELECSQDRVIGGAPAEVSAWQSGYCARTSGDSWECSCGDGETYLTTGSEGWSVCSSAAIACGN